MKKISIFALIFILIAFFPEFQAGHYFREIGIFKHPNFSIVNFGDVMFDRGVRNIIENRDRDPFEYFKQDLGLFKNYDIFLVNLEGPIVEMDRSLCQQKEFNFQFATNTVSRLKEIGVNMVTLANNHSYDCLKTGFESTKKYLTEGGIEFIGDNDIEKSFVIREIDGKKIAFVGIDETVQVVPLSSFYPLVKRLDAENDLVVVNIHWGTEYELVNNENQRVIAHKLIDSGADVIFGHHPHVIQNMEIYNGKAIFYSLGNFVFDQGFRETKFGLGVGVEFGEKTTFTLYPFEIKLFAPELMKENEKKSFCDKFLKNISHNECEFSII